MSNRYVVKCPHFGCGWSGPLSAERNAEDWRGFMPTGVMVAFRCPCCEQDWHARITDGKAKPTFLDEDGESSVWPPLEIGVGD